MIGTGIFLKIYRGSPSSRTPLIWGRPKNFDEKFSPVGVPVPVGTPPANAWRKVSIFALLSFCLEAIAKPDFSLILNEVKDLKPVKIQDSSNRSE
jgi:hypothetical protein